MKTFETERQTWSSGFRGYKDNSPDAKARRLMARVDALQREKFTELLIFGRTHYTFSQLRKIVENDIIPPTSR